MALACRALAVTGALLMACAQQAAAETAPQYAQTVSTVGLPGGAAGSNVYLVQTSCGSAGSCVSVGTYEDSSNNDGPLIVPVTDGAVGASATASLPADAATTNQGATLNGVSCWSAGACVAVGNYNVPNTDTEGLVVPISGGVPAAGKAISLPSDANAAPESQLYSVSCWSAGSCMAAGYYYDTSDDYELLAVPISGGTPGAGMKVALPANAAPNGSQGAQLEDISCESAGSCVAVGFYYDSSDAVQPLIVPITNGVAGTAVELQLPAGAAANPHAELTYVKCWSSSSCEATGYYTDSAGNVQTVVVPITNGVAGTAAAAPLPANAATSSQNTGPAGISCTAAGTCVIADYYDDSTGQAQAMAVPVSNGAVGDGVEVSLPGNAATTGQDADLYDVSCPSAGTCVAAGYYLDGSGDYEGMTVPITAETVGNATETPAPAGESTSSPYAYLDTIGCGAAGSCAALGTYIDASGSYSAYETSLQAPPAITTAVVPGGTVGVPYQQTLAASGAWGTYGWAVSAGSLPAGLTLNPQTGEISGTPTAAATSTFTVRVTGTGSPALSATQQFSVTVAAAPRPHVGLSGGSLQVRGNRVGVKLHCSSATCSGTVKLETREAFTVKHGKRRVHKHRMVVIGSARFSLSQGHSRSVTVGLNGTGRRLLSRARRHRLAVRVLVTTTHGNRASHGATIWTRVPKHRRH